MACKKCDKAQIEEIDRGTGSKSKANYLKFRKATIMVVACEEHIKELEVMIKNHGII